jgi:hypothetical protein
MKPAQPWMLAHLKIIWQFHQKVSRFFGPRYIGDNFFLGPNLVSFNRAVVCFYAEVNFWDFVRNDNSNKGTTARLNETRFGPKKVIPNISWPKKSRHRTYERGYKTSGSPLRFMLRRSSLVECVSVLHGNRCLQSVNFFFLRQYVQPCLLKLLLRFWNGAVSPYFCHIFYCCWKIEK